MFPRILADVVSSAMQSLPLEVASGGEEFAFFQAFQVPRFDVDARKGCPATEAQSVSPWLPPSEARNRSEVTDAENVNWDSEL